MPVRVCKQPNGRYALFSSVVDDFTATNCTAADMSLLLFTSYDLGRRSIMAKLQRADLDEDPWSQGSGIALAPDKLGRWRDALETIEQIHGKAKRDQREKEGT